VLKRERLPIALTIAGSDSGGGAGLQADLKTFAALRVHGTSAITCLTAQNPKAVLAIEPATPAMVHRQLDALFAELPPAAAKTGLLHSEAIIRTVADFWKPHRKVPLVVDPVMVATSGALLLKPIARQAMENHLLPLAALVTPNLDEAEILARRKLRTIEDLRDAARIIHERFGIAALIKGGHLRRLPQAVDIFYDGKNELFLSAPFVKGVSTHGTGCTYSAAVAGYLAQGFSLPDAVAKAKQFISNAIGNAYRIGAYYGLNTFWNRGR
jgi:hydroxymethylpyrimidine/phosphomethylpyrimidine kinase